MALEREKMIPSNMLNRRRKNSGVSRAQILVEFVSVLVPACIEFCRGKQEID
jgi:hypothetical protein